jgi:hypothetical protein
MTDTPTNNFATLNPVNQNVSYLSVTMADGNLKCSGNSYGATAYDNSILLPKSGKFYAEATYSSIGTWVMVGIRDTKNNLSVRYTSQGQKEIDGVLSSYGASWTTGDVIGIAADVDNGQVTFYKNGASQGTLSHVLTDYDYTFLTLGNASPYGATTAYVNFGQRPFQNAATWATLQAAGYKTLSTGNLPTPAVTNPKTQFDTLLYAGNNGTQNVTGLQLQPDLVWLKNRSAATSNRLVDSLRGATNELFTNLTNAETSETSVTGFLSNGFSLGSGDSSWNGTGNNYVAWCWKGG